MHKLAKLLENDMKESLGVTEPAAIAFAVAKAISQLPGKVENILVRLNSGMFKNAFTCGIPNTENTGNLYAAALGAITGDWTKGLLCLDQVTSEDVELAERLINESRVKVEIHRISSHIFIEANVSSEVDSASVRIEGAHTNVVSIKLNGEERLKIPDRKGLYSRTHNIKNYTFQDFYDFISASEEGELDFLKRAHEVNTALMEEGLKSNRTRICKQILKQNGGQIISEDEVTTAHLLTAAAIEARVMGLNKPAMSIAGSGNHGIICTLPLYAIFKVRNMPERSLLKATALSYLSTMYIKEYSGKLSAYCGCGIAAGTGVAVGISYLFGADVGKIANTINNMASSITGIICHGGNPGCVLKAITAIDIAYKSALFSLNDVYIESKHGINGCTPEETMKNMGLIASPGMEKTEETILKIIEDKRC